MTDHSKCVPGPVYWSLYNKIKDDMLYIENRELRSENNALKQKISELETKNLSSPQPTSVPLFSRGIAINTRTNQPTNRSPNHLTNRPTFQPTFQPTNRPTFQPTNRPTNQPNKCQAIRMNGRPCRQCNKETQSGGPIINGSCKYHR